MIRTKLIYLLGKSENELLAYDEYDSEGSGKWFTENPIMAEEYYYQQACEDAEKEGLDVYMWEVTYDTDKKTIIKEAIGLQFNNEEAIKNNEQSRYNAETEAAMQEARDIINGKKEAKSYSSVDELFSELDAEYGK